MADQNEASEFVCGSHNLEIVGYSIIKGLSTGKYIRSSPFNVGGHDWVVQFFPNGKHSYTTGYVSLFVKLLNPIPVDNNKVSAIISFSLRTREKTYVTDQSSLNTMNSGTLLQHFDADNLIQGVPYFMKKADLSSSKYLVDDSLSFRCILWVSVGTGTPVPAVAKRPGEPSPDGLAAHLGRLLRSGKGADVRFSIGEKTVVSAHRCVLAARSPVFRDELFGPESAKATTNIVALEGIDDITFQVLLHFIYTDSLPDSPPGEASDIRRASIISTQRLLAAAAQYKVEGLMKICEKKLCEEENITLETVATTLALAEELQCRELRAACMEYAVKKENYLALPLTEGFEKLKQRYPAVLKELVEKAAA